mmetsp:Transcript_9940/g.15275  ORF Transcript_9940/g.15275 Transcript_9940/m.15275 type:complete len:433 (-) Transcript_9940:1510-2808(-)|eukprot:CAMPEP_0178902066 /NCGR_PEP_ID=MMETSP0786-20121207/4395_1 /TAXON_ID=186022 /ORGANISM="Thalassionema frauenfeldii, Strain CCMP 1798" /LENGTH=432 /DNA_ID=CAMNT_0020573285 /DNA_START=129 /DNA_END=1427 /DNA_ORIENTATION=+
MARSWQFFLFLFVTSFSGVCLTFQPLSLVKHRNLGSQWARKQRKRKSTTRLFGETNNHKNKKNDSKNKYISASRQERRDEEKRRVDRKKDVIIGKTSAISGETDFSLNPAGTEEEWMKQASNVEQEVFRQTELGLSELKMLRLEESSKAFERVFELRPHAYCWQAGIAKYYLGDLVGAADIFARSARIYETRFGGAASEERIWRDACEVKYRTKKRKELKKIEGGVKAIIPAVGEVDEDCSSETRKVLRITRDLFAATTESDASTLVLSRAKLRSISGSFDSNASTPDRKMWKLNSWFYLGLHYDALGDENESKKCMKMALRLCPSSGRGDDIIHTLPLLHMSVRDWFDDDEFEPVEEGVPDKSNAGEDSPKAPLGVKIDSLILQSIRESISKLKFHELTDALKQRGLKHTGSKSELQSRLLNSLVEDTNFQ